MRGARRFGRSQLDDLPFRSCSFAASAFGTSFAARRGNVTAQTRWHSVTLRASISLPSHAATSRAKVRDLLFVLVAGAAGGPGRLILVGRWCSLAW